MTSIQQNIMIPSESSYNQFSERDNRLLMVMFFGFHRDLGSVLVSPADRIEADDGTQQGIPPAPGVGLVRQLGRNSNNF